MALLRCPDCRHKVSNQAPHCPGCGRPASAVPSPATPAATNGAKKSPKQVKKSRRQMVLLLLTLLALVGMVSAADTDRLGASTSGQSCAGLLNTSIAQAFNPQA